MKMNGKERIRKAFRVQAVDRIPWIPFVGVHGAFLTGYNADEYLQSADFLVDGINKAIETYKPDGIPVCFDLQIEAEALGCQLAWSPDNVSIDENIPLDYVRCTGGKYLLVQGVFDHLEINDTDHWSGPAELILMGPGIQPGPISKEFLKAGKHG